MPFVLFAKCVISYCMLSASFIAMSSMHRSLSTNYWKSDSVLLIFIMPLESCEYDMYHCIGAIGCGSE